MKIYLRPHHLLCIQGYKGHNYNDIQKHNWKIITNLLKTNSETDIFFVNGKDDLCLNCPAQMSLTKFRCNEKNVAELDKKVKNLIGIEEGKKYLYHRLFKKINEIMTPEKHEALCKDCVWWQKGLCKDTFKKFF